MCIWEARPVLISSFLQRPFILITIGSDKGLVNQFNGIIATKNAK